MYFVQHFKTITKHKILVMKSCFKVGLYKQGILHDLSKYTPVEFFTGVKFYQGNRSPNGAEKEKNGYSKAWLHHKGRNKHHFEYWIDYGLDPSKGLVGNRMPKKYVVEMFIDRMSACKVYLGNKYTDRSPLEYFLAHKANYVMHNETISLLEHLLKYLAKYGEEKTYRYIRKRILRW